jgi:hypothetical protein
LIGGVTNQYWVAAELRLWERPAAHVYSGILSSGAIGMVKLCDWFEILRMSRFSDDSFLDLP